MHILDRNHKVMVTLWMRKLALTQTTNPVVSRLEAMLAARLRLTSARRMLVLLPFGAGL